MNHSALLLVLALGTSSCRAGDPPIAIEGDPEIARIAIAETARRYPGVEVKRVFVTRYGSVREVPWNRSKDPEALAAQTRSRPFWYVDLRPSESRPGDVTLGGGAIVLVSEDREVLAVALGK